MKYPKRVTIIELEHSGHAGRVTLPASPVLVGTRVPARPRRQPLSPVLVGTRVPARPRWQGLQLSQNLRQLPPLAKMYQKRFAHMKREVKDNVERMLAGENVLAGWILAPKTRECRGNAIGQRLVAQLPWGHNIERKAS